MHKTRVGNVEVVALADNLQAYGAAQVYDQAGDAIQRYRDRLTSEGQVPLNFACFLLRADGRTVLVDTGWGPEYGGRLLDEMKAAGVGPGDVDIVIFTHLHGDHTGWNIERQSGKALFGRARYWIPEEDWTHYGSREQPPASFRRDCQPLEAMGCLDLFKGERALTPSLTTLPTPGHTPGHTSIVIDSAGERGLIIGDVVLSTIDVEEPEWRNTFDWDHDIARSTRLAVLERAERENAVVGASHLPEPALGRFVRLEGRRVWQAL